MPSSLCNAYPDRTHFSVSQYLHTQAPPKDSAPGSSGISVGGQSLGDLHCYYKSLSCLSCNLLKDLCRPPRYDFKFRYLAPGLPFKQLRKCSFGVWERRPRRCARRCPSSLVFSCFKDQVRLLNLTSPHLAFGALNKQTKSTYLTEYSTLPWLAALWT